MNLQKTLLAQFEPDIAKQLLVFGQHLSTVDADIFMFLARKSLRLYDVLLKLGISPIERCIVSDRCLDMRLDSFKGKRVALIDDTLILGTSLAKAKKQLEQVGAQVSTHVFCLDREWHSPEIIVPDNVAVELSDDRVMTFCTSEVRALSLTPRPYLVDFPLSRPFRIQDDELDSLLADTGWTAMKLTTELQERNGVATLTFFPASSTLTQFEQIFGKDIFKCLEILKVRMWAKSLENAWHVQIVPIVTLCPLLEESLATLSDYLLELVLGNTPASLRLKSYCESPRARQRLCQFIFSIAIGQQFVTDAQQRIGREIHWHFDHDETDRHYGPWLHEEMAFLVENIFGWLCTRAAPIKQPPKLERAPIPESVCQWTETSIGTDKRTRTRLLTKQPRNRSVSLLADFAEVFRNIYDIRELPARQEARKLGAKYLDQDSEAPNRDRLDKGVPWQLLVDWMASLYKTPQSKHVTNTFSLLLDLCNDVGIAVPVTCVEEGVVFRGYRHGEDVKFSDSELALAYDAAKGFLETSGLPAIPRLTFEKLLVLLIKVGASQGFLEVLYGASGTDGICKIGFDLKGARPMLIRGPRNRPERNLWLTDYLIARNVVRSPLNKGGRRGRYELGKRPEGNYLVSQAPDEAVDLGNIIGMLMRHKRGEAPIMNEMDITLLATCATPSHTAQAMQTELAIFRDWFSPFNEELSKSLLNEPKWIADTLKSMLMSHGYEALHSAKFKFVGFKSNQCDKIIEAGAKGLAAEASIFQRRWLSYWKPLKETELVEERRQFTPHINSAATLIWELATLIATIEIALRYQQLRKKSSATDGQLVSAISKFRDYRLKMISTGLVEPAHVKKLSERLEEIDVLRQTEFQPEGSTITPTHAMILHNEIPFFNPTVAVEFAMGKIRARIRDVDELIGLLDPLIDHFGKVKGRVAYSHMLYYDIIDSTATIAARKGKDVEDYRKRCGELKQHINRWLVRRMGDGRAQGHKIYPVNGSETSTNDCKHIFLGGGQALRLAEEIVTMLIEGASSFGMLVRVYFVPCNFVGSTVYRQGVDPEVKGELFWEHWSRVTKKCSTFEAHTTLGHFLLIAADELVSLFRLGDQLCWDELHDDLVTSEIAFQNRQTAVRYGRIQVVSQE